MHIAKARTIVVGDIHGCYDELQALLAKVELSDHDRLICTGDLIVKGEKNRDVLELFMSDARFFSVLGNHDRALLRFWRGKKSRLKPNQEKCRLELEPERERYMQYLGSLPLMIDLGRYLVVHAGLRPDVPLDKQKPKDLTELRRLGEEGEHSKGKKWYKVYNEKKRVLFGHWPPSEPAREPPPGPAHEPPPDLRKGKRAICLDSGCVRGGRLTAYIIESKEFVSVPAFRNYSH